MPPRCQIPQGVKVGRVTRALDFPHKFRVCGQERPRAPIALRALGDLSPPGAVHYDGMAPAPLVRGDHDRSVGRKHRAYRLGADARRIDEEDHGAASGRSCQGQSEGRTQSTLRFRVDHHPSVRIDAPVANDGYDLVASARPQYPHGPVDEPLAVDDQLGLGLPHSVTRTGRQNETADVGHPCWAEPDAVSTATPPTMSTRPTMPSVLIFSPKRMTPKIATAAVPTADHTA